MAEPVEIQQWLKDGIAAVKRGEREQGRGLLLRVVEADEGSEPGWLWLAAAVEDPRDQLVALDNVLTLNPHNAAAQDRAAALRMQLGLASPAPPAPPPPSPPVEPPPVIPSRAPEPLTYQCVYCGQPTRETDERCRHCGRNLMVLGKWLSRGAFQYVLLILSGLYAQLALLQFMGAAIGLAVSYGMDPRVPRALNDLAPGATIVLGNYLNHTQDEATNIFLAAIVQSVVLIALLLMFYTDMDSAYAATFGVLLAQAGWGWVAVTQLHWMEQDTALMNVGFAGVMALVAALALLNRHSARRREFIEVDRTLTNALALYVRGRELARRGKWAAAAVHWQKAAALKPNEAQYTKDLALALTRLGRYAEAEAALERGASDHPADAEFQTLLRTVREQVRQHMR